MRHRRTLRIAIAALALTVMNTALASSARAQRVIEFEEIVVEGRIQKPEAFYILQHASLDYEYLNPKPSFLQELLETVEHEVLK